MKRILNRDVNVNGTVFECGTDIMLIPEHHRTSIIDSGWTAEVAERAADVDESDSDSQSNDLPNPDPANKTTDGPSDAPNKSDTDDQSNESNSSEQSNQNQPKDNRLLSELGLDAAKLELLAANDPPITTVAQAIDFVTVNKTFRTIAGFGKQADQELRQKLGVL